MPEPTQDIRRLAVDDLDVLRLRTSAKWRSYPPDVLPLGVAEMDFSIAQPIASALEDALARSDLGYAQPTPALGNALSGFATRRWAWDLDPRRVTAVTDVGMGVVELLRVLTRPGDSVVINPPVYSPFLVWPAEAGARLMEVPLAHDGEGYRLDLERLERAFAQRPAVYVICNPHNPVGRAHSPYELETVIQLARKYEVKVISDEIHGPLALPGATFTPLLTIPGADAVAISVISATKAFNIAGLKCGAIVTGSNSMAEVVSRFPPETSWRVGHLGVVASVAAFSSGDDWLNRLILTLDDRRSLLSTYVDKRLPRITWHPPEASYLAWLDCTAVGSLGEPAEQFLRFGRVGLDRGVHFGAGGDNHVRLNFATSAAILDKATAAMGQALCA